MISFSLLPKAIPGAMEMLSKYWLSQQLTCSYYTHLSGLGELNEILCIDQ